MTRKLKQGEYYQFVEWYVTPPGFRKKSGMSKTQKQLAQELGVSEVVLSKWKDKETFDEDVKRARLNWGRSLTSDVVYALYLRATTGSKGCSAKVFKLWMDLFEPEFNND